MAPPLTVTDDEIELGTEVLDLSLAALNISAPLGGGRAGIAGNRWSALG
jgi:hypothetical protein